MSDEPEISSVLLCWNRLPLSQRCLASYLDTVSVPHELFVVDNGSTDATAAWVDSLDGAVGVTGTVKRARNDPASAINEALERCRGRLLHIMENDYLYLPGWDRGVLDRFGRIEKLGQLGLFAGAAWAHGEPVDGGWVARENVCTTSVLRRELFFEAGVRVRGHYIRRLYPHDWDLSDQVRRAGWLVVWPDVTLARNIGFEADEYARDPGYYVRDYTLKLFSASRLRGQLRNWAKLDFRDSSTIVRRLALALRLRMRRTRS